MDGGGTVNHVSSGQPGSIPGDGTVSRKEKRMAYKIKKTRKSPYGIKCRDYICDTVDDIGLIKTKSIVGAKQENHTVSDEICAIGSLAFVVESGEVYELNASGTWTLKPTPSNTSTISVLANTDSIQNEIDDSDTSAVALAPGTFTEPINFTRSINLAGYYSTTPANEGERCSDTIAENESIIDGVINVTGQSDVILSGLTFTENALINVSNEGSLTLNNCKIVNMQADSSKSYLIKSTQENPIKVTIENCYFGTNTANSVGNIYNGLELNCVLKDGSSISNNYFTKDACTHNAINIYAVEEGATIRINGNHFEYSGNAIRIGIKGEPECTIICSGNAYDSTDENDEYAGLLLVQPYGNKTTSFANCTIKINKTEHSDDKQLYYLYAGAGDMQFTDSNKPTIIVDGVTEVQAS